MAVGITQPGGAGTTIMFQTDTSAPDGIAYHAADFAAAFPADFNALGTTPQTYRSRVSLQNGDGALTDTTTWQDTRTSVYFDNTRTYLVSATGVSNRHTQWGTKATAANGELVGYDGLTVYFGTNPTFSGNIRLYGSYLANINAAAATSRVFLTPTFIGSDSELIDTNVFTRLGTQTYGASTGEIATIRRLTSSGLGSANNGVVVQFNCTDADTLVFYFPNGQRKLSTGGYVRIANPSFIGPSVAADSHCTVAGVFLNPIWSRNVEITDVNLVEEWFNFGVLVTDSNGLPISGATVEVWDPFDGRYVVQTTTNSLGTIDFLAPQSIGELGLGPSGADAPYRNALMVEGHNNDNIQHEHYPFTLYVNRGFGLSQYPEFEQKFAFPYETYAAIDSGTFLPITEKQYSPLYLNVKLASPGSATGWVELSMP